MKDNDPYGTARQVLAQRGLRFDREIRSDGMAWNVTRYKPGILHEREVITGPHKTWQAAYTAALKATDA